MVKNYIAFIILIGFTSLFADSIESNKYHMLGIDGGVYPKRAIAKLRPSKEGRGIDITEDIKRDRDNSTSTFKKILQYAKFKKISNSKSLCGICMNYKVSKDVQISVDILAEVNREETQ